MKYLVVSEDISSPRSRLGLQIWTAFGSIVKKFHIRHDFRLDIWCYFHALPTFCLLMAFNILVAPLLNLNPGICMVVAWAGMMIQAFVIYYVDYWYTDTPCQSVGARGRFMIECIPVIVLAAWHQFLVIKLGGLSLVHLLEYECGPIWLSLGCTTYFYLLAHVTRRAYDISAKDVIIGMSMQVLSFMVCGVLLVRVVVWSICIGVCICRYLNYSKRESEQNGKPAANGNNNQSKGQSSKSGG